MQLAEWLAKGNGMWKTKSETTGYMHISVDAKDENDVVLDYIQIRPFGTNFWLEPTLENMGMEE